MSLASCTTPIMLSLILSHSFWICDSATFSDMPATTTLSECTHHMCTCEATGKVCDCSIYSLALFLAKSPTCVQCLTSTSMLALHRRQSSSWVPVHHAYDQTTSFSVRAMRVHSRLLHLAIHKRALSSSHQTSRSQLCKHSCRNQDS